MGFLSTALFGAERQSYWRRRLADSEVTQSAAPAADRLKEVTSEVADLQRRIERQIANLEAEDTTPALRRRIAARVGELEEAVEDRRRRETALAQEVAEAPPTAADLDAALGQLPLVERLPELPQPELRALFDSLRLQIGFQPAEAAVDVEVTLFADELPDRRGQVAEVQSVHQAGRYSNRLDELKQLLEDTKKALRGDLTTPSSSNMPRRPRRGKSPARSVRAR